MQGPLAGIAGFGPVQDHEDKAHALDYSAIPGARRELGPVSPDMVELTPCAAARIGETSGVRRFDINPGTWTWNGRWQTTPSTRCRPGRIAQPDIMLVAPAGVLAQVQHVRVAGEAGVPARNPANPEPDLCSPQPEANARRDELTLAEAAYVPGAPDNVAMDIIVVDIRRLLRLRIALCARRRINSRGHSAGTTGRPIAAIVTAVPLGKR
jgi:hypothetical protein